MSWSYGVFDIETTGLSPASQIVAIGVCKKTEQGQVKADIFSVKDKSEPQIVQEFVDFFDDPVEGAELYSFNGTSFDFSMLRARTMTLSDYGDLNCEVADLEKSVHVDLSTVNKNNGNYENLESMCERFGIDHKSDVSGSDVPGLFEEGKISKIETYLKEDIRVTFRLAEAVRRNSSGTGLERKLEV
jgi:uncharacterized protein YprB with RNaseH-like and TPR domain